MAFCSNCEFEGDDKEALEIVSQYLEGVGRDARGVERVILIQSCSEKAPLGRYWESPPIIQIFMKWFRDLERLDSRVLLGRTVVHEVGHHVACNNGIEDPLANESFACWFEVDRSGSVLDWAVFDRGMGNGNGQVGL